MNTQDYFLCSSGFNLKANSIIASYNFGNQVDSVILNDLYPTGDSYSVSGNVNTFFLDKHNLAILKTGENFLYNFTGYFSGEQYCFVLTDQPLTGFSALIDFDFNNCEANSNQVLFVNNSGNSLDSGLLLGVNQVNRIFIEYGTGDGKKNYTCDFPISKSNVMTFSIDSDGFKVGKYDPVTKSVARNFFPLINYSPSDKLFLFKHFGDYSGFSGKVNQIFISNSSKDFQDQESHECMFCSGVQTGINLIERTSAEIDPSTYYAQEAFETQITGYEYIDYYSQVFKKFVSGISSVTGLVEIPSIITGNLVYRTGYFESPFITPLFDQQKILKYANSLTINFIDHVESGDLLEVYDYQYVNDRVSLAGEPGVEKHIALFSNGMLLISGLDYQIRNGAVEDSFDESDELLFNYVDKKIDYLVYSGLYDSYKQLTGLDPTTGYYPKESQFLESGDGNITITGLEGLFYSGFSLTDYDLFMNGQKLYTGIDYQTGSYGNKESVVIYASNFNDATLLILTGLSGQLTGIGQQTESILAFCPVQSGQITKKTTFLESSLSLYNISGRGEEVWLNGIKLTNNVNYSKIYPCSSYSYNFNTKDLPYIFCNKNDVFFNIN